MKNFLIILLSILLSLGYSTDALGQRASQKGFNYKAHQRQNAKRAKANAKKFKAARGDLTRMKCGKKRRTKNWARIRGRTGV